VTCGGKGRSPGCLAKKSTEKVDPEEGMDSSSEGEEKGKCHDFQKEARRSKGGLRRGLEE